MQNNVPPKHSHLNPQNLGMDDLTWWEGVSRCDKGSGSCNGQSILGHPGEPNVMIDFKSRERFLTFFFFFNI